MLNNILTKTEDELLSLYNNLTMSEKIEEDKKLIEDIKLADSDKFEVIKDITDHTRLKLYLDLLIKERFIANESYTEEGKLEVDEQRAIKKGYTFDIATKQGRGKPWSMAHKNIISLKYAFKLAQEIEAYEVGVFFNGKIYWKSSYPVINFIVIYS